MLYVSISGVRSPRTPLRYWSNEHVEMVLQIPYLITRYSRHLGILSRKQKQGQKMSIGTQILLNVQSCFYEVFEGSVVQNKLFARPRYIRLKTSG